MKTVRGGLGLSFSCPTAGPLLGLGRLSNLCPCGSWLLSCGLPCPLKKLLPLENGDWKEEPKTDWMVRGCSGDEGEPRWKLFELKLKKEEDCALGSWTILLLTTLPSVRPGPVGEAAFSVGKDTGPLFWRCPLNCCWLKKVKGDWLAGGRVWGGIRVWVCPNWVCTEKNWSWKVEPGGGGLWGMAGPRGPEGITTGEGEGRDAEGGGRGGV